MCIADSVLLGQLQVPGFTHPVRDVYLDDVLGMVGYSGNTQGGRAGAQQKHKAPIAPEVQAEVEAAIMDAFLTGGDAAFQRLVEVSVRCALSFC